MSPGFLIYAAVIVVALAAGIVVIALGMRAQRGTVSKQRQERENRSWPRRRRT
jgi:hypothetical protein